ncbi:MAG: twin-arginine translocase subunit TatC, partial [Halobacteriales archaeon]|nr:twin-arginine translocase subunit TatC [Halobacteriales archaeon]
DEGYLDEDTRETISAGRATAGEMLVAVRSKARRVFIVFVVGLLATIYAMRIWIWPILKRDLLAQGADVVAITPFDVILLQAKIGIMVGLLLSLPLMVYFGREPLRRRGLYPDEKIPTWKIAGLAVMSLLLLVGGVVYSYILFFPVMFDFLAHNAISAGLAPTYSIVDWTEFILVLAFSFALAAQLPLVMTVFSYTGIIPYETFRDKWKYAIVGMFGFGALFSPPDPFTQLMWAAPLVGLYAFSLYLARIAVAFKRGTAQADMRRSYGDNITVILSGFVFVAGVSFWLLGLGGLTYLNATVLSRLPASLRPVGLTPETMLPIPGMLGAVIAALVLGLLVALLLTLYYIRPEVESADSGRFGDPAAIDIDGLDAPGVYAAPSEAFANMDEE